MQSTPQRVAVLGASPKPERYSNMAARLLTEKGHDVIPVHPAHDTIENLPAARRIEDIDGRVDTVTVYLSPKVSSRLEAALIALGPGRVIFNPGAENETLRAALEKNGIETLEACTLVLLKTGQF